MTGTGAALALGLAAYAGSVAVFAGVLLAWAAAFGPVDGRRR